jgi:hypothetical protein
MKPQWDGTYKPSYEATQLFGGVYGWCVSTRGNFAGWNLLYRKIRLVFQHCRTVVVVPVLRPVARSIFDRGRHWKRKLT